MNADPVQIDEINRRTWRAPSSLRLYKKAAGYIDPAEEIILRRLAKQAAGKRVLDIGMGGGRTTELITSFTNAYIGIDYTPEMVEAAAARFPDRTFLHMDARNMSCFDDGSFDVIVFSCNGIDSVGLEGRRDILKECARLLVPGGHLFFSTFNRDGSGFNQRQNNRKIPFTANPVRFVYNIAKYCLGGLIGSMRILRYARFEQHAAAHSLLLHRAHDFGIFVYAATLADIGEQLKTAGFDPESEIFGCSGAPITNGNAVKDEYFQILARRLPDAPVTQDSEAQAHAEAFA